MSDAQQKQTPGGNRASANTKTDVADHTEKQFRSLQAQFALLGHSLARTNPTDGPQTFYASRWGLVRHLPTLDHARAFLAQIGGVA